MQYHTCNTTICEAAEISADGEGLLAADDAEVLVEEDREEWNLEDALADEIERGERAHVDAAAAALGAGGPPAFSEEENEMYNHCQWGRCRDERCPPSLSCG